MGHKLKLGRDKSPNISIRRNVSSYVGAAVVMALVAQALVDPSAALARTSAGSHRPEGRPSHMEMATAAAFVSDAPTLVGEGWTATSTSDTRLHPADAVLDGRTSTFWQSGPTGASPQSITIDLRGPQIVSGLDYQPGTSPVAAIGRFEISVSTDGVHFSAPVATGTWAADTTVKQVGFAPQTIRMIRLTALSDAAGTDGEVTAAEVTLRGALQVAPRSGPDAQVAPASSTSPSVSGQWGATIGLPLVPAASALLPGNQMLVWSADQDLSFSADDAANYTQTAIVNLTTGVVSPETVTRTNHNMFCPGVVMLPNGDVMVTGGDSDDQTSVYSPATNSWSSGPPMNVGRGYQAMTLLSNGQAFTLGGSWSGAVGGKVAEIWSPTGGWRELTAVPATPMYTADSQGVYRADNHGWFIATSGGRVLQAGPSKQMNWITTSGAGSISPAGNRGTSADAMNGNAVYYSTNQVVTIGGAPDYQDSYATNTAYKIDLSSTTPTVTQVGSLHYARTFANSVVLPDGKVLTLGGQDYGVPFSDATSVLQPELWNPSTGKFTVMAAEAEPRNYHSVALLLPDGRVFSGGGGLCGSCNTNHPDGQIFTPPYLLNASGSLRTRPTIVSAPASATTGSTISVTTGASVANFSMVRYGESTHSVDNDQRRVPLSVVSRSGGTYELAIPADPGVALPGPYMLFALDSHGTPSVSRTISITNVATAAPADAYGDAVFGDGPALYWPLSDSSGPAVGDASGNNDTGTATGGVTFGVPSPVEGSSGTAASLDGATGQIVASEAITNPTSYSEEAWFKTTTTSGGLLTGFGSAASGTSFSRDRLVWMTNSGHIDFGVFTGQTVDVQSPGSYNDGTWHQVVATQGAGGMNLYLDGQLVASNSTTQAQSYLGYWRVGAEALSGWPDSPTSNYFAGAISDVSFSGAVLSSTQVATHFHAAAG